MRSPTSPILELYANDQEPREAPPELVKFTARPMLPSDVAFEVFRRGLTAQEVELAGYSAKVFIRAEVAASGRIGEFELRREHLRSDSLKFVPIRFSGDSFVKHEVIGRMLQFQVDHKRGTENMLGAIQQTNYKITYEKTAQIAGTSVHIYKLKPRSKRRPGLFAGRITLDAFSGNVLRTEGQFTKPPSFFIKRLEFVQEYTQVGGFTFLSHAHTEVRVRMLGKINVDVYESGQNPISTTIVPAETNKPFATASDVPPHP